MLHEHPRVVPSPRGGCGEMVLEDITNSAATPQHWRPDGYHSEDIPTKLPIPEKSVRALLREASPVNAVDLSETVDATEPMQSQTPKVTRTPCEPQPKTPRVACPKTPRSWRDPVTPKTREPVTPWTREPVTPSRHRTKSDDVERTAHTRAANRQTRQPVTP